MLLAMPTVCWALELALMQCEGACAVAAAFNVPLTGRLSLLDPRVDQPLSPLVLALTAQSACSELNYERLEFLG